MLVVQTYTVEGSKCKEDKDDDDRNFFLSNLLSVSIRKYRICENLQQHKYTENGGINKTLKLNQKDKKKHFFYIFTWKKNSKNALVYNKDENI
jgi:hypothetical protein